MTQTGAQTLVCDVIVFTSSSLTAIWGRIQLSSTGSNDVRFLNCRGEKEHSSVRATSNCRCINNLRRTCHSSSKACLNKTIIMNAICEHKRKLTNTCFTRTISCELFHTICHISRRCVPAAGCGISWWNQQTAWCGVACSFFHSQCIICGLTFMLHTLCTCVCARNGCFKILYTW